MRNASPEHRFDGGQLGVELVDINNNVISIIGTSSMGEGSSWTRDENRPVNCYIFDTVTPGQYKLRIVTRLTDGTWKPVTLSLIGNGVPTSINVTVNPYTGATAGGGYGLSLESFSPDKTSVSQNESFNVTAITRNIGSDAFPGGQVGVALTDNYGNIVTGEPIRIINANSLNPNSWRTNNINNCIVPNAVAPGQYKLRIVVRPTGGTWRLATMSLSGVPNSIDFTVE